MIDNMPAHSSAKRPHTLWLPPVTPCTKPYIYGAGRYPKRFEKQFDKEFPVVLAESGTF